MIEMSTPEFVGLVLALIVSGGAGAGGAYGIKRLRNGGPPNEDASSSGSRRPVSKGEWTVQVKACEQRMKTIEGSIGDVKQDFKDHAKEVRATVNAMTETIITKLDKLNGGGKP